MLAINTYVKRLLIGEILLAILGAIVIFNIWGIEFVWGWLWGSFASCLYLIVLYTHVLKAVKLGTVTGADYMKKTALIRLLVGVFAMMVVAKFEILNPLTTVVGLFGYKLVIYLDRALCREV